MNILKTLMIVPLAGLLTMPAYADRYDYDGHSRFDNRVERQKSRIHEGVKSGTLTRQEAGKLRNQQKHISTLAREYRSDGHLSRNERKKLEKKQNKASNKIYRLKHNDQYKKHHRQHKRHDNGHHYGWYKKPYYGYRDQYYGQHSHGHRLYDDDGWSLVLRLSDDF